jgi:hypothetical protein
LVEVLVGWGRGRGRDASSWVCMWGVHSGRYRAARWWRCRQAGAGAEAGMPLACACGVSILAGSGQPGGGGSGRLGQGQKQGCLLLRVHVGWAFRQTQGSQLVEVQAGWDRGRDASSWVFMWGVHSDRLKAASCWRCRQAGAKAEERRPRPGCACGVCIQAGSG